MLRIKDGFKGERAFVIPSYYVDRMEENSLSALLHITDIGYYPRAEHHYRERPEAISQFVLIYCVEGAGWFSMKGKRYKVKADSYFIIPAGEPHAYGSDDNDPWTIYWVHFKGSVAGMYVPDGEGAMEIRPGMTSRIADRIGMFEEIMNTLDRGYSMEHLLYACSVFHHFMGSIRYLTAYRNSVAGGDGSGDMVSAAIRYMRENLEKKLKLSDIAQFTGYSASQFSALFTQQTGCSPIAYFNQLKIREACNLLDFTTLKINQIGFKIGISDQYYFSRLFHSVMGMSPQSYRRIKKG